MNKSHALSLLGGTAYAAAKTLGITPQAVADWPDPLPQRIEDRVLAHLWRLEHGKVRRALPKTPRGRPFEPVPEA